MTTQGSLNVIQKEDIVNKKTSNFSLSDRYINEDFLSEKKSLSTVYPGIQFPNIATHSNGETRNSMAFLGSLNNIRQYHENVNLKRMEVSGLYLEHIPENERSKIVCNRAFANNPYAVNYFPEPLREQTYKTKVFETLDKKQFRLFLMNYLFLHCNTFYRIPNNAGISLKLFIIILEDKLKTIGREVGSEKVIFIPRLREQFLMYERFAQDSGKVREVIYEKPDRTFELSRFSNGNIFNDLRVDKIKLEDTLTNISSVREKIIEEENKRNENKRFNITSPTQIIYHTTFLKNFQKPVLKLLRIKKNLRG